MPKRPINEWEDRQKHLSFWWSTFFGVGLIKPAPGTWGSLAALLAGYIFIVTGLPIWGLIALILVVTVFSVWAINDIEAKSGIHDAGEIVIDEVAGQWIALVPFYYFPNNILAYGLAFALFRLFDIWKPWPIGPLDKRVSGGFGVMVDDIVAGLFSALVMTLLFFFNLIPS